MGVRKIYAFLGMAIFVVGVLIAPAIHQSHLDDCDSSGHSESHNAETCAICKVAATALAVPIAHIVVTDIQQTASRIHLPENPVTDLVISYDHSARAPPVSA